MLKSMEPYIDKVNQFIKEHQFDLDYMYYFSSPFTSCIEMRPIGDDNYKHRFVSIDENGNINGFIIYSVEYITKQADRFGLMGFGGNSIMMMTDTLQAIDDIFNKYHLNKMSWSVIDGNDKVLKTYREFIKRYGGREVGYAEDDVMTLDGKLRNTYLFELTRKQYKNTKD